METYDKALLNEVAPTESGAGGGTELADVYVDQVSQDYDADQLQQASDDANELAGDKALTDDQLAALDKEAEDLVKKLNDVDHNNPESMTQEQIDNFYDMAFSVDPEWMEQHFEKFESLIDTEAIEKAYGEYKLEREYLSSEEYYRTFPGYAENKDVADAMWPYVSKLTFRWNVPVETGPGKGGIAHIAYYNGVEVDTYEAGWGALRKWGEANQAAGDIYYDTIIPTRKIALDKAFEKYSNVSSKAFRAFDMTMIKAWSVRKDFDKYLNTFDPDPYSLKDIPRGNATYDAASELALLGISAAIATSFVKAVGAASAAKLTSVLKKAEGIAKWYNKGRKPCEDKN